MKQGTPITSEVHCVQSRKNIYIRPAIQNKRHGMLTSGVVLRRDNARPHTAARTPPLLQHFNCEMFDHTPYSPGLNPSD
jgi:hypothetical protein